MKIWAALTQAIAGWSMILRGEAGWREHFARTMPGLVTALIIFAFAAFLSVAFASISIGMPSVPGVLAAMFVLGIPVTALVIMTLGTRAIIGSDVPVYDMLVPGVYAATAFLLVEGLLAMIGGPILLLSWFGLGYLLYRLARAAGGWAGGVAAGFAVLSVLLLVAMRMALYMLSYSGTAPL